MRYAAEPTRHIVGLDLVRFWAASAVALFHLGFWSWASPPDLPFRASGGHAHLTSFEPFFSFGWCGVETFFVLSGFVICASAEHSTPYAFMRGRVARLYPAVWICATLTAAVTLALDLSPPLQLGVAYLRSLTIFPFGPWVDTVYRTLIVEGVFYGLVLTLLLFRAFRRGEIFAIALAAYGVSFWLLSAFVDTKALAPAAVLNFSKYSIFFALGMLIRISGCYGATASRVVLIGILTACGAFEVHLVAEGMRPYLSQNRDVVAVVVWLTSVAAIISSVIFNESLVRFAGTRVSAIRLLGLMTYPIYLLHDVVGSAFLRSNAVLGQGPGFALALAASLALSYVVVRLEPLLRRPLLVVLDLLAGSFARLVTASPAQASRRTAPQ